ncbi:MAG: MFS transporter, partial [Thermoplasmata archaeon]
KKIFVDSFFPSFGVGLVFSIFYSIFPGFLFKNGYSILLLGIIITASSLTRLIGFFLVINLRDIKNMERIMKFSFLLLLFIIFPFFTLNFFVILIMALVIGFGSSVGISIPLIYISKKKDSDISKNIAIYELSFGASVSIFSLFLGWISQNYGNKTPYLIDFIIVLIVSFIYIYLKSKEKNI